MAETMECYSGFKKCQYKPKCENACALRIQVRREHLSSSECWCFPRIDYTDPITGASVYVHKEPQ